MFEYRLTAWPDLPPQFDRVGFRRALSDMSHRYMTVPMLVQSSGLARSDLLRLIEALEGRSALVRRPRPPAGFFGALGRAGGWLEAALGIRPAPSAQLRPIRLLEPRGRGRR
jgi:hypothetical protein